MDINRRYYANEIENTIKQLEGFIQHNKNTIERFKRDLSQTERVANLRTKVEEQENLIKQYQSDVIAIRNGERDDEIREKLRINTELLNKQNESQNLKKEAKKDKQIRIQNYCKSERENSHAEYQLIKEYKSSYKYFEKQSNSIPPYLLDKLKYMPENKGYVCRGIWFYGRLPYDYSEGEKTTMFERRNKDVQWIHEFTPTEYRLYERTGKNKDVLIKRKRRRNIFGI